MKKVFLGILMAGGMAAQAFAAPVQIDGRTVTQGDTTARLVRFSDDMANCKEYGVLTVIDRAQKEIGQKTICGAANILSARQGDDDVVYVYARARDGSLGLYRYMVATGAFDFYDFKASELRVISMGTEVMVQAFYPPLPGETKPQRESWTWHPKFVDPKKV